MLNFKVLLCVVRFLHYSLNRSAVLCVAERHRLRKGRGTTVQSDARVAGRVNGVVGIAAGFMAAVLCNSAAAADVRLVRMVDPEDMITIKAAVPDISSNSSLTESRAVWFVIPMPKIAATPRTIPKVLRSIRVGRALIERLVKIRVRVI